MLRRLQVEQFVIIDKLDLTFEDRLTIFTGETGAGKSIILGALGLILGDPPNKESIRQGAKQSVFDATLIPPKDHPVWPFLIEKGLAKEAQDEFVIHRVMKLEGDDEIKVNGKDVKLKLLEKIGTFLVEIHGQFANQSLLGPANQLHLLDLSGAFPQEVFDNVANALSDVHRYTKELEEEKLFLAKHKGLILKHIEEVVGKFESIGMKEGFIEEVKSEYSRLLIAKDTSEALQSILGRLIATGGIVQGLAGCCSTLDNQKNIEAEKMVKLSKHLKDSVDSTRAAVAELNHVSPEYEIDTKPLKRYKDILNVLKDISQANKIKFDDLAAYWDEMYGKLQRVRNGRERIAEIEKSLIESKQSYREHAHVLTGKRIEAGEALGKAITAEFAPLMLNKAQFEVVVEEKPEMEWTPLGFNEVTFTARMNPGMPFSPISETASGGELARMILALKVVLQEVQTTSTLVFDEVDTGIGGKAAAAVGERIALLAESTQVLVITHSPQVASRGDQHLHISKRVEGDKTISSVRELSMEERIDEISRMLAGDKLTEESQAAAQSLINEAKAAADARRQKVNA
ncbi:MAG: DNA repair protein RecN [Alphaproteobacteria bacterium]|nr:DNA repair protein RecN [Alphaproteobacteria bacterium]